jgi:hypothetical protein
MRQNPSYSIHLFHGMEMNYSSTLSNVTTMSSTLQNHTEVVDFSTNQVYFSYNTGYQSFTTPLADNKILFFLSALHVVATSTVPIQLDLSYNILNNSHY